jgi:hypothetical protein
MMGIAGIVLTSLLDPAEKKKVFQQSPELNL